MKLVFKGRDKKSHWSTVVWKYVSAEEVLKASNGLYKEAFFKDGGTYAEEDGVLTVTFNPTIYLDQDLGKNRLAEAKKHELRHYQDFLALAKSLKKTLEAKIKKKQDPHIDERWEWFQYDLCMAAHELHRQEGTTVPICLIPSGERPQ